MLPLCLLQCQKTVQTNPNVQENPKFWTLPKRGSHGVLVRLQIKELKAGLLSAMVLVWTPRPGDVVMKVSAATLLTRLLPVIAVFFLQQRFSQASDQRFQLAAVR